MLDIDVFTRLLNDLFFFQSQFSRPGFLCPHRENDVDWTLCSNANPHLSGTSQRKGISPPHAEIPFNTQKKSESCSTATMMSFDVAVVHIEKIILKEVSMGGDGRQYSFEVSSKTPQRRPSFNTDISSKRRSESSRIVERVLE